MSQLLSKYHTKPTDQYIIKPYEISRQIIRTVVPKRQLYECDNPCFHYWILIYFRDIRNFGQIKAKKNLKIS
jgi:hypothetical protein